MRASLLTIGDELLLGQVVDTNASWIGAYLDEHGIQLVRKATVGDTLAEIQQGLHDAERKADVVLLTGGLGPTSDDVTLEALAAHLGRELEFNRETFERIRHIFEQIIKRPMAESHRSQAFQPAGAKTLKNTQGTAPGIWIEEGDHVYVAMPGVPREMKYLMKAEVVPALQQHFPATVRRHLTLHTSGWGETQIASAIESIEDSLPEGVKLAYLPGLASVRVRLSATGQDDTHLDQTLQTLAQSIRASLPEGLVFGEGDTDLVAAVHELLAAQSATVATAESCTGGALAHRLVERAGASAIFRGGIVAYDNAVKIERLGVNPRTLAMHGAVSEVVVTEMVQGALEAVGADYAVATSGIAGPTGGSPEKPVGTVWLAAGNRTKTVTRQLHLGRDRSTNMAYSANAGLDLLRRLLSGVG